MADRQHLFRAKRKDNGEWVERSLIISGESCFISTGRVNVKGLVACDKLCFEIFEVIPETVCEWTGLEDKNGKKVFEGDIVKTHYANTNKTEFIEQVIFEGGCFRAQAKYKDNSSHSAPLYDGTPHLAIDKSVYMDSVEVIGNIHDNPELLEV